ncbi:MAG TPA: CoA-transferase [Candidatus Hydrogenedentes bacterium]|nr:CoA-transferase [Candidatus Hydrogenedentota bacterium]
MNTFQKAYYLGIMTKVALTWHRHDCSYACRVEGHPKFMSAQEAAKRIPDGAVLATSGLAANQRPLILYWAIRESFEQTGHPCQLTVMGTGGQGGRGKVPGTIEELGLPGLCTRLIAGHVETYRSMLRLAEAGQLELQCLPQGVMALLFEAQGRGEDSILTKVGINTFIDPRFGRGTPVADATAEQLVAFDGDQLRYRVPKVDVALFNAYAADSDANIYVTNCAMKAEIREIARAAKRNNGLVIANVARIVDKGFDEVYLSGELVDAVVAYPKTEQSCYVRYDTHFKYMTPGDKHLMRKGIERAQFVNYVMRITPRRKRMDQVLARLAADIFVRHTPRGALVNVGVGLPEEVCRVLLEHDILDHITLFTESGVIGGVPAPGIFFGAAVCPDQIVSSAEVFQMCAERLDTAILGVLQADSAGNVNVSKRTDKLTRYVGPGGFIDLTAAAKTILFVTKWMEGERLRLDRGRLRIEQEGTPKFVGRVDEITFSGANAVEAGKKVFYVTTIGVFQLTERGMELVQVMPGLDIEKDILRTTSMKIVVPEETDVPSVETSIVSGKGFRLNLVS